MNCSSRFKLDQITQNVTLPILSEDKTLDDSEVSVNAKLIKKIDVSTNSLDRIELHLNIINQSETLAKKIYVKFRTSIVSQPAMNTMDDWAYLQIDRLHPTTGEVDLLDLKYKVDISGNVVNRYVLNVPAVGRWISAVVWTDDLVVPPVVTFSWMRSS
tara:strand:- start:222 stop:695 length:474 start_codon:yes stop_codon:yes gene_type:complete